MVAVSLTRPPAALSHRTPTRPLGAALVSRTTGRSPAGPSLDASNAAVLQGSPPPCRAAPAVPEALRTSPETQRTLPERLVPMPETLRTAPKRLVTMPETLVTVPKRLRTVPETLRTTPESLGLRPERLGQGDLRFVQGSRSSPCRPVTRGKRQVGEGKGEDHARRGTARQRRRGQPLGIAAECFGRRTCSVGAVFRASLKTAD